MPSGPSPSARKAIAHGEVSGLGEDPRAGVKIRHAGRQGRGRQPFGQRLAELEPGQCPLVHGGQAQAFGGVGRPGLLHLQGQVAAHPQAGVVKALHAVGQVGPRSPQA